MYVCFSICKPKHKSKNFKKIGGIIKFKSPIKSREFWRHDYIKPLYLEFKD